MMTHEIVGRGMELDAIGRLLGRLERHAFGVMVASMAGAG
jgi:hypothetical protein